MPAFAENANYLQSLNTIRLILMQLSADGIKVISFRAKESKSVIEVQPDDRLLGAGQHNGFSYYIESGVSVIWRSPEHQESAS